MFLTCSAPAIIIPCYSIVFGDFFASTAASKFSNAALLYPQFTKWVALNHDIYEAGRKEMQPMRNCSKPKMEKDGAICRASQASQIIAAGTDLTCGQDLEDQRWAEANLCQL